MSVEKVNYNQIGQGKMAGNSQPRREIYIKTNSMPNDQVNFTANVSTAEVKQQLMKLMPPIFRGMQRMKNGIGEFQNIVINSIGTGIVAPLLIKYNFLSKTDEDTRTYTAWRQPISAFLAIMTQALITLPFDYIIKTMVNNGEFGLKYNLTFAPDEKLLRKEIIKNNKNKNLSKAEIDELVKAKKNKNMDEIVNTLLTENKIKFSEYRSPNLVSLPDEELRQLALDTIKEELEIEKGELKKSYKIKTPLRIQRADFYRTHPEETFNLLTEIQQQLDNTKSDKELKSFLKHKIKTLKKENAESELLAMLQETYDRHSFKDKKSKKEIPLRDVIRKKLLGMFEDYHTYSNVGSFEELQKLINKEGLSRVRELEGTIDILQHAKKSIETNKNITINEVYETIKQQVAAKGLESRFEEFKLPKAMIERLAKLVKSNVSALKQMSGLVVSFAILPLTCHLLNWTYPKFMDAVFPNLSNKKHDTESSNLIEIATNKAARGSK